MAEHERFGAEAGDAILGGGALHPASTATTVRVRDAEVLLTDGPYAETAEVPDEPEARGLLALLLLQDSRRATRLSAGGDLVLLEDQDRSRWDRGRIVEGVEELEQALRH